MKKRLITLAALALFACATAAAQQTTPWSRQFLQNATSDSAARGLIGASGATALDEVTDASVDWVNKKTLRDLELHNPAYYRSQWVTNSSLTFDYFNTPPNTYWYLTGNSTIGDGTPPLADTYPGATWYIRAHNPWSTNCTVSVAGTIRSETAPAELTVIAPGEYVSIWIAWDGGATSYHHIGGQGVLDTARGGTGTTFGAAVAPSETGYIPEVSSATNYVVAFGSGRYMEESAGAGRINVGQSIKFASSSGRPTAGTRKENTAIVANTNTTDAITILPREDWFTIGWGTNNAIELATNSTAMIEFHAYDSSEADVVAINRLATSTTLAGGGSPPTSTLNDGLTAAYKFEATSGSVVDNVLGDAALDLYEFGGAWTKSFAGIDGLAWTNISTTRVLTNDAAALELGRSGASFTVSMWVALQSTTVQYIAGEWNSSGTDNAWRVRVESDNDVTFQVSSDGSNVTGSTHQANPLTAGAWKHLVLIFDNDSNVIQTYVDNVASSTTAFASNIYDSATGFAIGGFVTNAGRGAYDEVYVWSRALTSSEVEELWGSGSGKFCDGSGTFAP